MLLEIVINGTLFTVDMLMWSKDIDRYGIIQYILHKLITFEQISISYFVVFTTAFYAGLIRIH